ncbi:MAG: RtcB family protein, partial [Thermodesulfobacteriota bacterium]|nr:RtcB family protein [Thermodesulfobacteriota bacterium]
MDIRLFKQKSEFEWHLPKTGNMRVPAIVFADKYLLRDMDDKVLSQLKNVAGLPGIVKAALAMPDAHSGYGFPIGGVGAFDPDKGGVVSAGGVGFDIACGVRTLITNLDLEDVLAVQRELADLLFARIPAGLGVDGDIRLKSKDMEAMLRGGARWAVKAGFGEREDLEHTEEGGVMPGAEPGYVSDKAKKRMQKAIGTLGSGNHYLEVQKVTHVFDEKCADAYGLKERQVLISIHCGSRGLGH